MNVDLSAALTKPVAAGASTRKQSSASDVDYQSFLKLLVAQMKNQDPTSPMDSTAYMAQLAAFSQVEQSVQMNDKLSVLLQSSALGQADAIIGRTITSADGKTTGTVASVKLAADGLVAVLANGAEVKVATGVTVGQ